VAAQIFNLGKIRFTYKGAYSGATEYQLNDVVKYQGSSYVYINQVAGSGNNPGNTTYWSKMTDGIDPTLGTTGTFSTSKSSSLSRNSFWKTFDNKWIYSFLDCNTISYFCNNFWRRDCRR
jgi:hypothetical protein